jgi:hypothetical protein
LSIVFYPVFAENNESPEKRITGIAHVESVDLVFEPAADGRILKALSTYRQHGEKSNFYSSQGEKTTMTAPTHLSTSTPSLDSIPPETPPSEATETSPTPTEGDSAQRWLPALAQAASTALIEASNLPAAARTRLQSLTYQNPAQVSEAIEAERSYLASLVENQVIQTSAHAPRSPHIQLGLDGLERLSLALEGLITGRRPTQDVAPLSGIREAYMLLSGDYEMTGLFHSERIQLANVTSATMSNLVANVLNKVVINLFMEYPRWWEKFVTMEDFSTLQAVKWVTLGGVGELPTVAEGASYTEFSWDDWAASTTFVKKGGYLGLTLEAIDKDDTRRIQAAPRALAQATWLTLGKSISSIFTANAGVGPTLSDSLALFHATHGNLGSATLSVTTWAAARLAMRKMTEINSSERLGTLTAPRYLLVPPDLEITALQVLASEQDYTYALANGTAAPANPFSEGDVFMARMNFARERVVVIDLWTDTNNWAAVADPRLYPSIGLGFRYGRTPEIYSVASPTAGLMFTADTMPIKVRFFFAVGPTDYRGLYKANVT